MLQTSIGLEAVAVTCLIIWHGICAPVTEWLKSGQRPMRDSVRENVRDVRESN